MAADRDDSGEFEALKALSAWVGAEPALVQGAGGNTSVKQGGVLWIKASGTWLMNALRQDIMVPVAMEPLLAALDRNDPAAEKAADFVLHDDNPSGLRPSIETTMHAVLPQRIVVHVHCVETIAVAVRADAEAMVSKRLAGLDWAFVPYARPGLPLSRAMLDRLKPGTDVIVLGNHGLVVAADTVSEAAKLLAKVSGRMAGEPRDPPPADLSALEDLARDSEYGLPGEPAAHGTATDPVSCRIATGGSLYPDHVIFLGVGSVVAETGENADAVCARQVAAGRPAPVSILFPGLGVLMRQGANAGAQAMARCLADVAARIPPNAPLRFFSDRENGELLNWDAEKYRQTLNAVKADT